jgi:hypothetical protein
MLGMSIEKEIRCPSLLPPEAWVKARILASFWRSMVLNTL